MIPFSSSLLCVRPGRNPFHQLCIIEPAGILVKTRDEAPRGIHIVIPDANMEARGGGGSQVISDGGATVGTTEKNISSSEWILLETLDCRVNRPLHAGPFLTVQRRRRRRKYVRTYLFKDPTLIDDLSVHQTNFVLARINHWAFNAFILDNVTGGRPLPTLCVHLFKDYGLLQHFNLDPVIVWKLFSIIEDGYHWRNPYHNGVHAADVTQAMHCFLQERLILEKLTPLEIFSAILAAVTHDLDHPGVNQPFLIATSNHLAALYKNSSVLENHHWRSAMGCLNESGVSSVLGSELVAVVEEQIKSLVLATDITRQQEFLTRLKVTQQLVTISYFEFRPAPDFTAVTIFLVLFKSQQRTVVPLARYVGLGPFEYEYLDTNTLDMNDPAVRHFVLQIALKCADISNPCRPWDISRKWSMKVCEEFFRQGDYERQLNLPVTPLCDRYSSSVPKIQTGFYQFVVRPLFTEWHRMLSTNLSTRMMGNLDSNKLKWDQMLVDETAALAAAAAKTQAEYSDGEDTASEIQPSSAASESSQTVRGGRDSNNDLTRSVRFDPHTTVTAASDSENSDGGDGSDDDGLEPEETGFLGIPGPYARRHSIATGLMGSHIQVPPGGLLSTVASASNSRGGSTLSITDMVTNSRTVARTVIRRESLPGTMGRTLPTKTILHLQRLSTGSRHPSGDSSSDSSATAAATMGSTASAGDFGDTAVTPASPNRHPSGGDRGSRSSSSTTDEILDFTYSLPDTGSRCSGSPRRHLHDTTDLDELCPGTSILSMSPSVAHVTLHQSGGPDIEDQRRHLIRQQTCPVVSVSDGSGNFNRPRFLSAAAAVSPTAVASSSILAQHRSRNRSPEIAGEEGGGRCSGGSSSEALVCEVISEEGDRISGGSGESSSAEASPLEIYVKQFPPGADDNEAEAPRSAVESEKSQTATTTIGLLHRQGSFDLETNAGSLDELPADPKKRSSCPQIGQVNNNPMWRTKRVWKSLTEEDAEYSAGEMDVEDLILSSYYHGGNALFNYQQGMPGARLLSRRGSAPSTGGPAMGCRGAQDRRSDPTHYRSHSFLANLNNNMASFLRDPQLTEYVGSKGFLRPLAMASKPGMPRMGRRGSLPLETSGEASYAYKWMQIFPYNEEEGLPKRRSSGGPELFAAAAVTMTGDKVVQQGSSTKWKAQVFVKKRNSTSSSASSNNNANSNASLGYYWPARRRGSLPLEVCMASSESCSCESESSGGDGSDT